jgi:hypothetical protein
VCIDWFAIIHPIVVIAHVTTCSAVPNPCVMAELLRVLEIGGFESDLKIIFLIRVTFVFWRWLVVEPLGP